MIFYITLILMAMLITIVGILTIKALIQMYEQFYWHKPTFKEEAKKRYERKINKTNATKRIQKTNKKV
jgi:hypothetical protein